MRNRLCPAFIMFFCGACSGSPTQAPLGRMGFALSDGLILDQSEAEDGEYEAADCGRLYSIPDGVLIRAGTIMGQTFVPSENNVAAVTLGMVGFSTDPVLVRVLDSTTVTSTQDSPTDPDTTVIDPPTGPSLAEMYVSAPESDSRSFELEAEFPEPAAVVPGNTYAIEVYWTTSETLQWRFNSPGGYADGAALGCGGTVSPSLGDFVFATYADPSLSLPTFEDAEETLATVDPTPGGGDMTGNTRAANEGKLGAFLNKLAAAREFFESGQIAEGCSELRSARGKVTGRNAWFEGEIAEELLAIIDSLAEQYGCP